MTDRPLTPESEALLAEMRERYAWWPAAEGTRVANILAAIEAAAIARDRAGLVERVGDLRCESFTRSDCWGNGRQMNARYAEDQACWPCRIRRLLALDAPEAQAGDLAERLAEADTVVRDYPRVMAERDAARQRIAALEAAVPDDPWRRGNICYKCGRFAIQGHKPDCAWLAAKGTP